MAANVEKAKRRGRPPAPDRDKKRHTLSFRLTDELKEKLQERADRDGRSLSETVEAIMAMELSINRRPYKNISGTGKDDIEEKYNHQIKIMNGCVDLQNIIANLLHDLIEMERLNSVDIIHPYVGAFIYLIEHIRGDLKNLEFDAMEARNDAIIDLYSSVAASGMDLPDELAMKIKSDIKSKKKHVSGYVSDILEHFGIDKSEGR